MIKNERYFVIKPYANKMLDEAASRRRVGVLIKDGICINSVSGVLHGIYCLISNSGLNFST